MRKSLLFLTDNRSKFLNFANIAENDLFLIHKNMNLPDVQGSDLHISDVKLKYAIQLLPYENLMIDSSSMSFDALSNHNMSIPGPYIKSFFQAMSLETLYNTLSFTDNKRANVTSTIGFYYNHKKYITQGIVYGRIVKPSISDVNLNDSFLIENCWDTIFMPDGYNVTYDKMSQEEKFINLPHYKALQDVIKILKYI